MNRRLGILLAMTACPGLMVQAVEPIQLRVETLTVPPATGPLAYVVARNTGSTDFEGELSLTGPAAWQLSPPQRPLKLAPGQTQRMAFNIAQGQNLAANRYPFEITARCGQRTITQRQETFVASAPYFKATVDGRADEWQDAIPVAFQTGDRQTTVSTAWNRRRFSLLVAVEEERLLPYQSGPKAAAFDAVQFAIAPLESEQAAAGSDSASRYEFLLLALPEGGARCFQLAEPASRVEDCPQPLPLVPCAGEDVEVAVSRLRGVTYYECSLSFGMFGEHLRPSEGREFYFSVLVHDPDGTGIRDLAQAAGVWPTASDRNQWTRWPGARWSAAEPLGHRVRWGLCTSKY